MRLDVTESHIPPPLIMFLKRAESRDSLSGALIMSLCAGDRYVVVDCGGGTVDLTVHQIRLPEGHLKELYKASGRRR